jgi:hypothetical protein
MSRTEANKCYWLALYVIMIFFLAHINTPKLAWLIFNANLGSAAFINNPSFL